MRSRRRAYTLLELTALPAVLLVAAMLASPELFNARERARQATCRANLKQLALATLLYCNDYDGRPPAVVVSHRLPTRTKAGPDYRLSTWRVRIQPYAHSAQLQLCPSHTFAAPWDPVTAEYNGRSSYAANDVHGGSREPGSFFGTGAKLGLVRVPAETVMLAERAGARPWFDHNSKSHGLVYHVEPGAATHNRGANVAFVDGHAAWAGPWQVTCSNGQDPARCWWSIE